VGQQQNLPLDYMERIPRRDYAPYCLALGVLACLLLLIHRRFLLRSWP
jgi:mxaC protein